jgi:hypothetical protein
MCFVLSLSFILLYFSFFECCVMIVEGKSE